MADDTDDKDSRTQEASEKKLRQARQKGDVPTSKEGAHLLIYGSIAAFVGVILPADGAAISASLGSIFANAGSISVGTGIQGMADLRSAVISQLMPAFLFVMKTLALFFGAAIVAGFIQGPFVVSAERITPKLSKLSPLKGIKKIFGKQNLVEFMKSCIKLTAVGFISLFIVYNLIDSLLPGAAIIPQHLPALIQNEALRILILVCAFMVPIVIADQLWQRFSYLKKQRMTLKELRDEHKESEGDPLIKGKRHQMRQKLSRQRIAVSIPDATLIVTNPTHFAVALRYERGVHQAPICVAKGADSLAARIRRLAHEHDVPVIESRALARALYASVEVDEVIPEAHWPAVAELVSFVLDLKRKIKRPLPENASLRED